MGMPPLRRERERVARAERSVTRAATNTGGMISLVAMPLVNDSIVRGSLFTATSAQTML
jgi:hypothetical protein